MIGCDLKIKENSHVLVNQFHGNFRSKSLVVGQLIMFQGCKMML